MTDQCHRCEYQIVESATLRRGDVVLVETNDVIPADGTVIDGAASVSEGAVTGEAAPVLRAMDRNCSSVRRGTRVLSDWLVVRVGSRDGFFDPIVTIWEGTRSPGTRQEIAWSALLATASLVFLFAIAPLAPGSLALGGGLPFAGTVALLVCSIPITTRALAVTVGLGGFLLPWAAVKAIDGCLTAWGLG